MYVVRAYPMWKEFSSFWGGGAPVEEEVKKAQCCRLETNN